MPGLQATEMIELSGSCLSYARFILRMYDLALQGKFESEEADAEREKIESGWDLLSHTEQAKIRKLSLDLTQGMDEFFMDTESRVAVFCCSAFFPRNPGVRA